MNHQTVLWGMVTKSRVLPSILVVLESATALCFSGSDHLEHAVSLVVVFLPVCYRHIYVFISMPLSIIIIKKV